VPALGITGGIATGKSTFIRAFLRQVPAALFDADQCAHELLAGDAQVHSAVREAFGPEVFNTDGIPDRALLRGRVFDDPLARRQLEAILHPIIRRRWLAIAEHAHTSKDWHCFDIPLLYETGAEAHFDRVIVVACSPATQRQRLCATRGFSDELAAKMIAAQFDLRAKITRSHHLIWNDSTPASLEAQAALLINWLRQRYG
jgi:dephospho-CoA kinase